MTEQQDVITVLVADMVNLVGASETKNGLWARLGAAITAYGGSVGQQRDGSLLGYFEPTTRKDDAERAIRAGLALQTELRALEFENQSEGATGVLGNLSIGINTGLRDTDERPANMRPEHKTDESAVALAAYLQEQAPPGTILISHNTYRYVRGIFNLQPLVHDATDSSLHPDYYLVVEAKPRSFYVPTRGVAGVETRMVGRSAEFEALVALRKAALEREETHLVTLIGKPGVGKSRLLYEFENYVDLSPTEVWLFKASAQPPMRHVPFALIREIFTWRCDILSSDTAATARDKLVQMIQQFIPGKRGEERAHFIGHLFGLSFVYSPYLRGVVEDSQQVYNRALHYIGELFTAISQDDPVVVFFEDLQWADSASLAVIEYLATACPRLRMIIACAARPELLEWYPGWGQTALHHHLLELEPLREDDSHALVTEILRRMPVHAHNVVGAILDGAGGNPLAIEERILLLHDSQVIDQTEHHWYLEQASLPPLPATLEEVIRARLDRLSEAERRVLQQAAVIGRYFWDNALAHLVTSPDGIITDLQAVLEMLHERDLIIPFENSRFAASQEYVFKHSLIKELVLMQVTDDWQEFHGKAASWLVTHSGQRVREYAGLIAYHYEQAGETAQAMEYLIRAGRQALAIAAYNEAQAFFERALAIMSEAESLSRRVAISQRLGEVYWQLEQYEAASVVLDESLRLARKIGDQQVMADSLHILGRVALSQAHFVDASRYLEESLAVAREIGDRKGMANTLNQLGHLALLQDRLDDAQSFFDQCLSIYQSLSHMHEVVKMFDRLAEIAYRRHDLGKTKGFTQVALAMAHDIGSVPVMLQAIHRLAMVALDEGHPDRAVNLANIVLGEPATPPELFDKAQSILESLGVARPPQTTIELETLVDAILNGVL